MSSTGIGFGVNLEGKKLTEMVEFVISMDIEKIPMEKIPNQNEKKTEQYENQIKNTFTMQNGLCYTFHFIAKLLFLLTMAAIAAAISGHVVV